MRPSQSALFEDSVPNVSVRACPSERASAQVAVRDHIRTGRRFIRGPALSDTPSSAAYEGLLPMAISTH